MSVEIERVETEKQLGEFIKVPWAVYEEMPNWVPWLYFERLEFFDKRANPFFEHAEAEYFIARRNDRAVGTIAAILNHRHNEFQQENVAHFGAFEVMNDREAALSLLDTAIAWARSQGVEKILGPATFTSSDEFGLLIEGFDRPPVVLTPYNPPYYREMIEAAGFQKAMDLLAWYAEVKNLMENLPEKVKRVVPKVKDRYGLKIRTLNMDDWENEVARIKKIYNSAWERNWGFVPLTNTEIDNWAETLKLFVDPAIVFIVEKDGEAIGVSLALPDLNQPLGRIRPRPSLASSYIAALRLYLNRYNTDLIRVWALGVEERFRARGVDALMYYETLLAAAARGYKHVEASWILETNEMMNRAIQMMGGKVYKKYRMYEKQLS